MGVVFCCVLGFKGPVNGHFNLATPSTGLVKCARLMYCVDRLEE